jgi:hypothetical protein
MRRRGGGRTRKRPTTPAWTRLPARWRPGRARAAVIVRVPGSASPGSSPSIAPPNRCGSPPARSGSSRIAITSPCPCSARSIPTSRPANSPADWRPDRRGSSRPPCDPTVARLHIAGRWFASTRTCSRCGVKTKLSLRDRIYRCRNRCPPIDRDLNAAVNLARLGGTTSGGATGTGTGSGPAAGHRAGQGRGANQKTRPATAVGKAGGDEASNPARRLRRRSAGDRRSARNGCLKT